MGAGAAGGFGAAAAGGGGRLRSDWGGVGGDRDKTDAEGDSAEDGECSLCDTRGVLVV